VSTELDLNKRIRALEELLNRRSELTVTGLLAAANFQQKEMRIIRSEAGFKVLPRSSCNKVTEELDGLIKQLKTEIVQMAPVCTNKSGSC
jgi:hypothetical protein